MLAIGRPGGHPLKRAISPVEFVRSGVVTPAQRHRWSDGGGLAGACAPARPPDMIRGEAP